MTVSRRTALKALALPAMGGLTGLGAAGCAAGGTTLNVAVVWSGWELQQFQKVMNAFTAQHPGIGYRLLSMGDDVGAFLGNEVTAAAQPDVALVPQPATVLANRDRLVPLPGDGPDFWPGLLVGSDRARYGAWYKAANMSMVWHTPGVKPPLGGWDWDKWQDWCFGHAGHRPAPLSIGAADGWVLADWFSNVLLAFHPCTYRELVGAYHRLSLGTISEQDAGEQWQSSDVAMALHRLGDLWRQPGLFPGGAERALAIQFDQSVLDVFGTGQAMMVAGADYYWPIITQDTRFRPADVGWFPFPGAMGKPSPVVTAGDAAVLFARPGRGGEARLLIDWLGSATAAEIWAREGGFLSLNSEVKVSSYPSYANSNNLVGSVQGQSAMFNLSDLLSGPLAGGDGEGAWKIFTDFFTDVAVRGVPTAAAVGRAVNALARGYGGA